MVSSPSRWPTTYSGFRGSRVELKRRINRLAALFELADQEFINIRDAAKVELQRGQQVAVQLKEEPRAGEIPIDVFGFLGVASSHFPTFSFLEHRSDSFLQEVLRVKPNLTAAEFAKALETKLPAVYAYPVTMPFNMNPFTMIRHALYAYDPASYSSLLFLNQRGSFGAWLHAQMGKLKLLLRRWGLPAVTSLVKGQYRRLSGIGFLRPRVQNDARSW